LPLCFLLDHQPAPTAMLFPYTTLFRSRLHRKISMNHAYHKRDSKADPLFDANAADQILLGKAQFTQNGIGRLLVLSFVHLLKIEDRKSTRLNSSHVKTSYAVFCLKKKT